MKRTRRKLVIRPTRKLNRRHNSVTSVESLSAPITVLARLKTMTKSSAKLLLCPTPSIGEKLLQLCKTPRASMAQHLHTALSLVLPQFRCLQVSLIHPCIHLLIPFWPLLAISIVQQLTNPPSKHISVHPSITLLYLPTFLLLVIRTRSAVVQPGIMVINTARARPMRMLMPAGEDMCLLRRG
ncbi:hypothetical protein I307_02283 [Cryptococcus deuterogattii 99/473]|uniref:Uncharacterized protein n=1 Tax=Cryptococcus deuterogattii Ram5 TaxID=1296110 RepID=A0A0D0TY95_9TREE|nr:hypothetical protein I313_03504 [Cryptococcus deuterogattii Ram5]KIY58484.1 hypothetical protein I307_02283 [Cryptococcus deuterogattii 99/473]